MSFVVERSRIEAMDLPFQISTLPLSAESACKASVEAAQRRNDRLADKTNPTPTSMITTNVSGA